MSLLQTRQDFQPSCPNGGTWYSCGAGVQFVGCCTADPCNENGCSAGNLRAASFNASYYGSFPDLECDSGQFYTCTTTDPPFVGCCRENACRAAGSKGCPQVSLTGAHLPDNAAKASPWGPTGGTPSSTASASATTSAAADSDSSTSTAAIAGGAVGATVVLFFVVGALIWQRRRRVAKRKTASSSPQPLSFQGGPPGELPASEAATTRAAKNSDTKGAL
ncbi:hypothetical protein B0J12DRAFT_172340 [Macrophomina phaseolina]|uniref:Uncharacterized protein n=1 Tax=Macrophomina phaseolina TaxID=35725 RepID=A0ABQ8GST4_9PEZI|nr:hypothetical protein B0J12DRAFT_172340 [Macrophomina phaseolina]